MTCITNVPRSHKIGVSVAGAKANTNNITTQLAILSNNHVWTPNYAQDDGHNGTPFRQSESVVYTNGAGSGAVTLIPRPENLTAILPLLVGGTWDDDELEPAAICNFFRMQAEKSVAVFMHSDCKTASWSFQSSSTSPMMRLEWNIESCKLTRGAAGSFTSGLSFSDQQPFTHSTATLTIDGDEYKCDDVTISGNNNLITDIYYNSDERTDLPNGDMVFQLTHSSPFDVSADLALLDLGASSVAASIVYTSHGGECSLQIDFPALHAPVVTPITPEGNRPVRYEGITWTARSKDGGKPIKFTLDADETPA